MSAFTLSSGRAQKAAGLHLNPAWTVLLAITCALFFGRSVLAQTPAVGAKAADFTLLTPTGKSVTLSAEQGGRPLVLVILRGFPGYQCPYCVKQVHDFVDRAQTSKRRTRACFWSIPDRRPTSINTQRNSSRSRRSCLLTLFLLLTLTIRSPTSTGCAGMRRTRRLIHLPSFSMEVAPWCSRRSVTATAIACPHRMRSITFPRTNVVAAPRSFRHSLSSTVASRTCKTLSNDFYSSSLSSLLFLPFAQLNCAKWVRG